MRAFLLVFIIVMLLAVVLNIYRIDFDLGWDANVNSPYIVGLSASFCALLLAIVMLQFRWFKSKVDKKSKKLNG